MAESRRFFGINALILLLFALAGCEASTSITPIAGNPVADKAYYSQLLSLVSSEVQQSPQNIDLRIKLAGYHQTLGWPKEAGSNMEAVLQMAPKDPQVMVLAADYYIHQNDFEKSWIYAQQADRLGSVHPSLSLIKSRYHYARRNYKESSRFLDHYFQSGGSLPEAYLIAAELQLSRKDTSRALVILKQGVAANPGQLKITRLLAQVYSKRKAYDSLASLVTTYQEVTSDALTFRKDLLDALFWSGDYAGASKLASAWPAAEENGIFYYGNLFLEASMPDSVNACAERLIAQDSLSVPGRLLKARYFNSRGRLGDAYNNYSMVLEKDSTNQIALEERGIVVGKIAYLRKMREEQAAMPVFDVAPKKSDN